MTTEHSEPVPRHYQEWRHCIEHWCGLKLTPDFIERRLQALDNRQDDHTRRLIECYGEAHLRCLISWYQQAAAETSG